MLLVTFEHGNVALTIFLFSTDCRFGLRVWVSFDGVFDFFFLIRWYQFALEDVIFICLFIYLLDMANAS